MRWFGLLLVIQIAYSFSNKPLAEAFLYSGMFAVFVIGCRHLGEWTSPKRALDWLIAQRQAAVPVVLGPIIYLLAVIYSSKYPWTIAILEAMWIYFFAHASLAIWGALVARIKR